MSSIGRRIQELNQLGNVNISLLCVGIGSGFPTFVAMELRQKYHNGMSTIPAVFLVNDFNTEIQSNFQQIRGNYLMQLEKVKIDPPVKQFPWSSEPQSEIYETSTFISMQPEVTINGQTCLAKLGTDLIKSEIEELFRSWTQELQLRSLKENVRTDGQSAVLMMEFLMKSFEARYFGVSEDKSKLTVLERIELKERKSGNHLLMELISECKKMRDGCSLIDLSPEEAAKRLAIGTQQGKYHNRALQMRELEMEEFNKFKEEFLEKLSQCSLTAETTQEPSFILLSTQKDIFREDTLAEAIKRCSPYELIENFPMVGHTVFISRSNASMINPFATEVVSIPKISKVCDTISLVTQGNEMEISIGNDEEEKFNAVLPLFDSSDADIKPLIRSRLYHLLMTFNVMRNVDTFFFEAYMGLLANTLVRLIKYPPSVWRENMIDLVYNTTEMVYGGGNWFETSVNMLLDNPRGAMVTEHKTEKHKCEDISKMILCLLVLKRRSKLNENECSQRIFYMIVEHIGRGLKEGTTVFEEFSGDDTLNGLRPKDYPNDQRFKSARKSSTDAKPVEPSTIITSTSPTENVIDINAVSETVTISSSVQICENTQQPQLDSLDKIAEHLIATKEYQQYESIRFFKRYLQKRFESFISGPKAEMSMNIKLRDETFNNPKYRMSATFFFYLHNYFCPELEDLDPKVFWIAVNHGLKFRDSNDRSQNEIQMDYDKIRAEQKKSYFEKKVREEHDKLYDAFEKKIIDAYLSEHKNQIQMIKDFHCSTDLLKLCATFDHNKPFANALFFGPHGCGKSSILGRLMKDAKCIDEKLFEYYKICYQKFDKTKTNYPYEWVVDTSAMERVLGFTTQINTCYVNTEAKMIQLIDTPGKVKYLSRAFWSIYMADNHFLCVEADKFKNYIDFYKSSFYSLKAKGCKRLHILLTKSFEIETNQEESSLIVEAGNYFHMILDELQFNMDISTILPVSAYTGKNIDQLLLLLQSLEPPVEMKNTDANAKLLVLETHRGVLNNVAYAYVVSGSVTPGNTAIVHPSLKQCTIDTIQINFQKLNHPASSGRIIGIGLDNSNQSYDIKSKSVLHVNNLAQNETIQKKIKEVSVEVNYFAKHKLTKNTCVKIEHTYLRATLQIIGIHDHEGKEIDKISEPTSGIILKLQPTKDLYFESLWNSIDSVIIRGDHNEVEGYGKIIDGIVFI